MTSKPLDKYDAAIADKLGWKFELWRSYREMPAWFDKQNHLIEDLPDFFSNSLPIKTRLEMVNSLTEEELSKLLCLIDNQIKSQPNFSSYWHFVLSGKFFLTLDQPTFAKLFCQVTNLQTK